MSNLPVVLTVDVGNSHTVVGIFRGEDIVEYWRLTTRPHATSDEAHLRMKSLIDTSHIRTQEITHLGLSTVVPSLERPWVKALNFLFERDVQVVSSHNCLDLGISYPNPSLLGTDRICNVLALKEDYHLDHGIVVDMGTATSFDVLQDGSFQGGVIVPGINASLDVLTQKAARLLPVTLDWTDKFIANTTDDAIRAGLLYGFLGQLDYLLKGIQIEMNLGSPVQIFATGGWSSLLMERTDLIHSYDPYLTLRGVRRVALGVDR